MRFEDYARVVRKSHFSRLSDDSKCMEQRAVRAHVGNVYGNLPQEERKVRIGPSVDWWLQNDDQLHVNNR